MLPRKAIRRGKVGWGLTVCREFAPGGEEGGDFFGGGFCAGAEVGDFVGGGAGGEEADALARGVVLDLEEAGVAQAARGDVDDALQRDVVVGIGDHPQIGEDILDFLAA